MTSYPVGVPRDPQPSESKHRVGFLDSLRFLAATSVLFQHTAERGGALGQGIVGLLSPGVFGVVLFFIISGFVIPLASQRSFNVRSFALARVFRIYPLVLFVFAILFAIRTLAPQIPALHFLHQTGLFDWIANILLIQDYVGAMPLWGVTWTLSLEVFWYVLFGVSLVYLGPQFEKKLWPLFSVFMLLLAAISLLIGHRFPLGRIGMIYAALFGNQLFRNFAGERSNASMLIDLVIFSTVMVVANLVSFGYFHHPNITLSQSIYPWIEGPIVFVLAFKFRHSSLLDNAFLRYQGKISFSTYLLHPLLITVFYELLSLPLPMIATFVATYGFAALSYQLVELPGQRTGKMLAKRLLK